MAKPAFGEEEDPTSRYQNPRYSGKGVPDRAKMRKKLTIDERQSKADSKLARSAFETATTNLKAKCGHEDLLGYFSGTVCKNCARKGHKKATGK